MINTRRPLVHTDQSKLNEAGDEIIQKKALKTDTVYNVVILNIENIKKETPFTQSEINKSLLNRLSKRNILKKKHLEAKIIETMTLEKNNVYCEYYEQNKMWDALFHVYISMKEKPNVSRCQPISDAILIRNIMGPASFNKNKSSKLTGKCFGEGNFPYYDIHSIRELLSSESFGFCGFTLKESQADTSKWLISKIPPQFTIDLVKTKEENLSMILFQPFFSSATISGYLSNEPYLRVLNAIKPFISLVEGKKHHNELLKKMDDQASSIEVFNLNDPECIKRFLKIFDID